MSGIVRKIDDLGRIVIPKEIRSVLSIKNNEELEIITDGDNIILKKYYRLCSFLNYAEYCIKLFEKISGKKIVICDMEKVIATSENLKELKDLKVSDKVYDMCINRCKISDSNLLLSKNKKVHKNYYFNVILNNVDVIGSIILFNDDEISDIDIYTVNIIKVLLQEKLKVD